MDTPEQIELKALRDRVATLEAARTEPLKVEIDGLEGLKQWSHAVETQQLNLFYELNGTPKWGILGLVLGLRGICCRRLCGRRVPISHCLKLLFRRKVGFLDAV